MLLNWGMGSWNSFLCCNLENQKMTALVHSKATPTCMCYTWKVFLHFPSPYSTFSYPFPDPANIHSSDRGKHANPSFTHSCTWYVLLFVWWNGRSCGEKDWSGERAKWSSLSTCHWKPSSGRQTWLQALIRQTPGLEISHGRKAQWLRPQLPTSQLPLNTRYLLEMAVFQGSPQKWHAIFICVLCGNEHGTPACRISPW